MITKLCLVLWVLPNDTLNVVINRKKEGKLSDKITFKGTASKISEYLSKTKFYYYDIKPNKEELPRDYNSRIDSLTLVALNKFNDFKRNNKLPGWFVEYEKIDIFLFSESLKQSQYNQRYWMYKQAVKTKATETQTINRIINEYKINQYNKYLSRKMLVMAPNPKGRPDFQQLRPLGLG
ncbi:MAG: hypothetical protein B6I20_00735 [Bacteroidetes bacterium 4572_117]|nr:MAG: hypothetical protein B6I20_00735 [Bacteroidetes bacterium 4572_117]